MKKTIAVICSVVLISGLVSASDIIFSKVPDEHSSKGVWTEKFMVANVKADAEDGDIIIISPGNPDDG